MNRPYFSLLVAAILTWSALRGAADLPAVADGYARTGLADRRLATMLLAFVVGSAVWRASTNTAREA